MPSIIGLFFVSLGSFFYGLRYICAAIMYAGEASRSSADFHYRYLEIGPDLTYAAILFFAIGVGFLVYSLAAKANVNATLESLKIATLESSKIDFSGSSGKFD